MKLKRRCDGLFFYLPPFSLMTTWNRVPVSLLGGRGRWGGGCGLSSNSRPIKFSDVSHSVVFSIFTRLCNYHSCDSRTTSSPPKQAVPSRSLAVSVPFQPTAAPPVPGYIWPEHFTHVESRDAWPVFSVYTFVRRACVVATGTGAACGWARLVYPFLRRRTLGLFCFLAPWRTDAESVCVRVSART